MVRVGWLAIVFGGLLASVGQAQDKPAAEKTEPSAPAAAAQAPGSSQEAAAFDALLKEWNDLLKQLAALQTEYKQAKPEDRAPIRTKFEALVKQAEEELEPRLHAAAIAAFKAEPNKNQEVSDVMVSMVFSARRRDDYETMLKAAETLIAGKYDNPRIYELAGIAAFQLQDYAKAEADFKLADEKSALGPDGTRLRDALETTKTKWAAEQAKRAAEAKADDLPRIELVTNKGRLVIELFENEAPGAVANFVHLVENKFYDGLTFHRVLENFMAQGGDPQGTGAGGPGWNIACECEKPDARMHFRGVLSMAHAGKDTGGSQFFLTFVRTEHLDGKHTVFGRVIEGFDVLSKLQRRDPGRPGPEPDKIISAKVLRKREHPYEPKKLAER